MHFCLNPIIVSQNLNKEQEEEERGEKQFKAQ